MEASTATKKFQKEMSAGTASLVLLSVLSRHGEPMYGYQIAKLLEEANPDLAIMKQGSLYPVLRSLEENGLLVSTVEPSVSGPPRRYYAITGEGRAALAEWTAIWKQVKQFVDANLKG
ncbi:MAG: PadR family transcriptional regulator [Anaerolineales bacterium]|nr:PadR family transcriptional regulator [Anaerolineales bacterium]